MDQVKEAKYKLKIKLLKIFIKTAGITMGGGVTVISELKKQLVIKQKLIPEKKFSKNLSLASIIPGPMLQNFSLIIGKEMTNSFQYAILLTIISTLPSIISTLLVSEMLEISKNNEQVYEFISDFIKGAKIACIINLALIIKNHIDKINKNLSNIAIFIYTLFFSITGVNFIYLIITPILLNAIVLCIKKFKNKNSRQ